MVHWSILVVSFIAASAFGAFCARFFLRAANNINRAEIIYRRSDPGEVNYGEYSTELGKD